jgi:uncharacterized protein YwqG
MFNLWMRVRAMFRRPEPVSAEQSAARVAAMVEYLKERRRPCLHLVAPVEPGLSRLGGVPPFLGGLEWPRCEGRPLAFLAQVELAEVRRAGGPEWLPDTGRLLFFFDMDGFDAPGSWAVFYRSGEAETALMAAPPDLPRKHRFGARAIGFAPATSYPIYDRTWHLTREFSEQENRAVEAALGVVQATGPEHQIGGYPRPLQSDFMEAECQHALNHEFGAIPLTDAGVRSDLAPAGFEDWRLLLQLDSDEEMGSNWGDGGTLYFWIREQDALAGDFTRIWVVMQFY